MTNSNQILQEDHAKREENFYSLDHTSCPGHKFL